MSSVLFEIKNIKKRFGKKEALKGVNFTLHEGEIFSLLGVNGAGKTTLSTIVATLKPPTEGDIFFKGESIYKNVAQYRQHLGLCQQKPNLNGMLSLEDNLRFAGRYFGMTEQEIDQRIPVLAKQLGITEYLQDKASVLSGGYKQRFMIARSIIHQPKLIILDEPTVALDPHIRHQLWEVIKELKAMGITVLLTTHYLDEAEYLSDRVCVLDRGVVKLIDTPKNLLSSFKKTRLEDVFLQLMQDSEEHTTKNPNN